LSLQYINSNYFQFFVLRQVVTEYFIIFKYQLRTIMNLLMDFSQGLVLWQMFALIVFLLIVLAVFKFLFSKK